MTKRAARELAHDFRARGYFAVAAPQAAVKDFRVIVQLPEGSRGFTDTKVAERFLLSLARIPS